MDVVNMSIIRTLGTVKEKEVKKEKVLEGTENEYLATYYNLYIRFTNPETQRTTTEVFRCKSEYHYHQYYKDDTIKLRRNSDKILWIFDQTWKIDD